MIVEYVRYALAHRPEDLIEAYRDGGRQLDAAPECLDYELTQCADNAKSVIVRIRWQSAEAHMDGFRRGPHFPSFLKAVRPFAAEIVEMRHYVVRFASTAAG